MTSKGDSGAPTPGRRSLDPALARTETPESSAFEDDDGDEEEDWLRELAAAPPILGPIGPGTVVDDSYEIERELGQGGMGTVYLARDVQLDRPVALKMLLGSASRARIGRFRREARAMARLSHPNVLTVYEVGPFRGQLYIAMEYAESGTARDWMKVQERPWQDSLALWIQAGRGLAAAHRVGVVHRDFKPDNVLIRADGRAQVADFGLAHGPFDDGAADDGSTEVTARGSAGDECSPAAPVERGRLTATGSALGTPYYMSPEQFAGLDVSPASDQFAFCVVLYESLFGQRPFEGATTMAVAESVCAGRVRTIEDDRKVPPAIVRVILRGLSVDPKQRFESLDALLDTLEQIVAARRRRVFFAATGSVAVVALATGLGASGLTHPSPCEDVGRSMQNTWEERRGKVEANLRSMGGGGPALFADLDEYARGWVAQREASCRATRVRGEQAEFAMQLRHACLDRLEGRFDGLTGELAEASALTTDVSVIDLLPPLESCQDLHALEQLHNRLASTSVRDDAEQDQAYAEGLELVVRADTRLRMNKSGARELAQRALSLGEQHDLVEVEATALRLLAHQARLDGQPREAAELYERAVERFAAFGATWGVAEQMLYRAIAALQVGDAAGAEIHLDYAAAFSSQVQRPEHARDLEALTGFVQGRLALLQQRPRNAVELLRPVVGHPPQGHDVDVLSDLGRAHLDLGDGDAAAKRFEQALDRVEGGSSGPGLEGQLLTNLGIARVLQGRLAEAVEAFEQAMARARAEGRHEDVVRMRGNLAWALRLAGRVQEARTEQEAVLRDKEEQFGPEHPTLVFTLSELAELARRTKEYEQAVAHLERGEQILRTTVGPGHPLSADLSTVRGRLHLDQGRPREAEVALRAALELRIEGDPTQRGEVEYLLARATWGTDEAETLLSAAQERLRDATGPGALVREEMQAWLRSVGAVTSATAPEPSPSPP